MRVLCIISSSDKNRTVEVKRGSYYNVTKVVRGTYHKELKTDIWYELLETGTSLHVGSLFVLTPDEKEPTSINNQNKKSDNS